MLAPLLYQKAAFLEKLLIGVFSCRFSVVDRRERIETGVKILIKMQN